MVQVLVLERDQVEMVVLEDLVLVEYLVVQVG